ncbi:MAG TPA: sigma 54-interacting transcriptional regulator [Blastocatellia bacterium]|nr:sigma 54-interacting transcriptional regulator [Blastocatellia bacterium]
MSENTTKRALSDLPSRQYLALLDLSKAIAQHRDISDLFHDLACRLKGLFDFNYLGVYLHDGARNVMRLHILETCEPKMWQSPSELPIEGTVAGWVWQNQQPLVIRDLREESRFPVTQALRDRAVRSLCVLPLTTAQQQLGVLSVLSDKPGTYDSQDLEFAQLVAGQIAVAVGAQCYQHKLARERERSELLLEVNNMLVSNLDLRELLSSISVFLRRVIPHDLAGIALRDPVADQLRLAAMDFPANENFFVEGEVIPFDGNPAGLAFTTRQTIICNEPLVDGPLGKRFSAAGVKSCCIVPLISHDRSLGVLAISSLRDNAFTEQDADLLGQIAKQVAIAVENALAFREIDALKNKLEEEKLYLEEEIRTEYNFDEIIGSSSVLKRVLKEVETVAATDSTVLIYGETGTGKELIARAIHNLSPRRERTLVKVNCGAIPTGLLESEMFGHEKGAFTGAIERRVGRFELANRGTIFLDEVEDIPLELQPKLLRVLQEQEFERLGSSRTTRVDVRVVAATNSDLNQMVADKKFRSDLFYRFNVFPISLPPLRERPDDIPLLVNFFASRFAQKMKRQIEKIPAEAMARLTAYNWPGNIRELQNLIERAVILTRGSVLEIPLGELKQSAKPSNDQSNSSTLEAVEREHILRILDEANWVIAGPTGAAARLGLNRTTLNNRMRKLGITRPRPSQQ